MIQASNFCFDTFLVDFSLSKGKHQRLSSPFLVFCLVKGIAGLAVTYGLNLNMLQTWFIWNLCQLENKIISVERMLQYSSIPSEPPLVIESNGPDPSWPSNGEVDIHDLQVRANILVGLQHKLLNFI